jgi:multidrug efflux pump subunit AcrA (membrane-fusion protein)
MFATAKVLLPGGENAVFVPRPAVLRDRTTDSYQVFTIDKGTAHLKVVVPGESDGAGMRIASGLAGNETVATGHLDQLFDGASVEVRNP